MHLWFDMHHPHVAVAVQLVHVEAPRQSSCTHHAVRLGLRSNSLRCLVTLVSASQPAPGIPVVARLRARRVVEKLPSASL